MNRLVKGLSIDKYTLVDFKGEGTTAQVWSAIDVNSNDKVALKIFAPKIKLDQQSKSLLKEEYIRTKEFVHSNIIAPINYIEFEQTPVLVMKLCNYSLWDELKKRQIGASGKFTENELAKILFDISSALEFIHHKRYIHHDIKPANILCRDDNGTISYHLTDFGITKEIRETIQRQTKSRGGSLTLAYAAPERLNGTDHHNVKSDIFSLGSSIYELINGIKEIPLGEILNNNGSIESINGGYSIRFKELVKSLLAKNPESRPSAKELLEACKFYYENNFWNEINFTQKETKIDNNTKSSSIHDTQLSANKVFSQQEQNDTFSPIEPTLIINKNTDKKKKNSYLKFSLVPLFLIPLAFVIFTLTKKKDKLPYEKIGPFLGHYACVEQSGKAGVINAKHELQTEINYTICMYRDSNLILIDNNIESIFKPTN